MNVKKILIRSVGLAMCFALLLALVLPTVGGTAYPANKLLVLAPWIALAVAIIAGATIFIRRRRA